MLELPTPHLSKKDESGAPIDEKTIVIPEVNPDLIKQVRDLVTESEDRNRKDIEWLSKFLQDYRKQHAPALGDSALIDRLVTKISADRDAVAAAKDVWYDSSERILTWLNLRKLTRDAPSWGHYESAVEMLENHEKLPFVLFEPISGCDGEYPLALLGDYFKIASIGRVFSVYKLLLIYSIFSVADHDKGREGGNLQEVREKLRRYILLNTQFVYDLDIPAMLHSMLSDCSLYFQSPEGVSTMLIPNSGYVFGGEVRALAPYNRGLDCTSFTGWITGCGRPLTFMYEIVWRVKRGMPPGRVIMPEDIDMLNILFDNHAAVGLQGSEISPGDILIWRHLNGGGHAMMIQQVVDDKHVMTVECTNYKQGHYEGYQERVVPILDPQGGETYVLRPLHQQAYENFRDRNVPLLMKFKKQPSSALKDGNYRFEIEA